jgi:hypothetical protein
MSDSKPEVLPISNLADVFAVQSLRLLDTTRDALA